MCQRTNALLTVVARESSKESQQDEGFGRVLKTRTTVVQLY